MHDTTEFWCLDLRLRTHVVADQMRMVEVGNTMCLVPTKLDIKRVSFENASDRYLGF